MAAAFPVLVIFYKTAVAPGPIGDDASPCPGGIHRIKCNRPHNTFFYTVSSVSGACDIAFCVITGCLYP